MAESKKERLSTEVLKESNQKIELAVWRMNRHFYMENLTSSERIAVIGGLLKLEIEGEGEKYAKTGSPVF